MALDGLPLFLKILKRRNDATSTVLAGLIYPVLADAESHLEFVRRTFPSYTRHGIAHSLAILQRITAILSPDAIRSLTSVEIFLLVFAAAFHDTGMAPEAEESPDAIRARHARASGDFVRQYLKGRGGVLSEHVPRMASILAFVVEAHESSWDTMVARPEFNRPETLLGETVRPAIIAILLRVGDLLDLDGDRSSSWLRTALPSTFAAPLTRLHHEQYSHIESFLVSPNEIRISVACRSREEHELWATWLVTYLKAEILNANTYVFFGDLALFRLPKPEVSIHRAPDASYELWPLRFEIDEGGKIWDVISKSIYTGKLDFVRELIQNALDAVLLRAFQQPETIVNALSPRCWAMGTFTPSVVVVRDAGGGRLHVLDNGVGMSREALASFLFRVAESGYDKMPNARTVRFPAIAKFGIGFVSVLTRAKKIEVDTKPCVGNPNDLATGDGRRVTITGRTRDAYVERVRRNRPGTSIFLDLETPVTQSEIERYIERTFLYPSVPILLANLGAVGTLSSVAREHGLVVPDALERIGVEPLPREAEDWHAAWLAEQKLLEELSEIEGQETTRDYPTVFERYGGLPGDPRLREPQALVLDRAFQPARLEPPNESLVQRSRGILWIPVTYTNWDLGIEWYSVHGLLYNGGSIVLELERKRESPLPSDADSLSPVSTRSKPRRIDEDDDNEWNEAYPDLNAYTEDSGDDYDDYDEDYDDEDYLEEDDEDEFGPPELRVFVDYLSLTSERRAGGSFVLNRDSGRRTRNVDFDPWRPPMDYSSTDGSLPPAQATVDKAVRLLERVGRFGDKYTTFDESVCQDGVRFDISAASIAPVGVCRAALNLTADARFALNVTRSSIDESPQLIAQWFRDVGSQIAREASRVIAETVKSLGMKADLRSLWVPSSAERGTASGPTTQFENLGLQTMGSALRDLFPDA